MEAFVALVPFGIALRTTATLVGEPPLAWLETHILGLFGDSLDVPGIELFTIDPSWGGNAVLVRPVSIIIAWNCREVR